MLKYWKAESDGNIKTTGEFKPGDEARHSQLYCSRHVPEAAMVARLMALERYEIHK